jgi:DNA mismatch endonuclease (patch repair protein)
MDIISEAHRSWNMAQIKSADTSPEVMVRSALHRRGFRFRKNVKDLPGKPDIVLPKYGTVIFVHGCFWHRHKCSRASTPKSNVLFWDAKFKRNVENDKKHARELRRLGWRVITIWECRLLSSFDTVMNSVVKRLRGK